MSYCVRCGAALNSNVPFCPACGSDLPASASSAGSARPATGAQPAARSAVAVAAAPVDARYAGFWLRFAASLIDGVILGAVSNLALPLLLGDAFSSLVVSPETATTEQLVNDLIRAFLLAQLMITVLSIPYYVITLSRWGQTVGAKAVGIRVVGEDGKHLSWAAAFLRYLVSYPSALVLGLGYLWMLWDGKQQTWHDKAAGSYVVKVG